MSPAQMLPNAIKKGAYDAVNTPVQSVMEQPFPSHSAVSTHPHHYSCLLGQAQHWRSKLANWFKPHWEYTWMKMRNNYLDTAVICTQVSFNYNIGCFLGGGSGPLNKVAIEMSETWTPNYFSFIFQSHHAASLIQVFANKPAPSPF